VSISTLACVPEDPMEYDGTRLDDWRRNADYAFSQLE